MTKCVDLVFACRSGCYCESAKCQHFTARYLTVEAQQPTEWAHIHREVVAQFFLEVGEVDEDLWEKI